MHTITDVNHYIVARLRTLRVARNMAVHYEMKTVGDATIALEAANEIGTRIDELKCLWRAMKEEGL